MLPGQQKEKVSDGRSTTEAAVDARTRSTLPPAPSGTAAAAMPAVQAPTGSAVLMDLDLQLRQREASLARLGLGSSVAGLTGLPGTTGLMSDLAYYRPALSLGALAPPATATSRLLYGNTTAESLLLSQTRSPHATYLEQQRAAHAIQSKILAAAANLDQERSERSGRQTGGAAHSTGEVSAAQHESTVTLDSSTGGIEATDSAIRTPAKRKHDNNERHGGSASRKRSKAPTAYDSNVAAQRAKSVIATNFFQPVVVVQNWSKRDLLKELTAKKGKRSKELLFVALENATGYTERTVPKGINFPPSKVTLTMPILSTVIEALEGAIHEDLADAIEKTFYRCSQFVEKARATEASAVQNTSLLAATRPSPPHLSRQRATPVTDGTSAQTIENLKKEIEKLKAMVSSIEDSAAKSIQDIQKKAREEKEQLKAQISEYKLQQARSMKAYMKASIETLRQIKKSQEDMPQPHATSE